MFNFLKKQKFPTLLFVAASLAAFILLPLLFLFLKSALLTGADSKEKANSAEQYYGLKNKAADPFITKGAGFREKTEKPIISAADPSLGSPDALVTIIIFSDFTCDFCKRQEQILQQIVDDYRGKIKLIRKDYPENSPSSASFRAAAAARCAGEQGRFWEYGELIYQNNNGLSDDKLMGLAKESGIDAGEFKQCFAGEKTAGAVRNNITEANDLDISGVPFIYVNDLGFMGEMTYEELKNIVERELQK